MAEVYVLVHRDAGLGDFFATREEADEVRRAVVRDEPAWEALLWVERLEWDPARDEAPSRN